MHASTEEPESAAHPPRSRFHPVPTHPVFLPPHANIRVEVPSAVLPEIPPPKKAASPAEIPDVLPAPAPVIERPKPLIPVPPAVDDVPSAPAETQSQPLEVTDDPPAADPTAEPAATDPPATEPADIPPAPKGDESSRRSPPMLNAPEVAEQPSSRRISALITRPGITVERWKPPTR